MKLGALAETKKGWQGAKNGARKVRDVQQWREEVRVTETGRVDGERDGWADLENIWSRMSRKSWWLD